MDFEIVIPSYKRATDCVAAKYLDKASIAVHEFEAEEYRKNNKNNIKVIPDNLQKKGMGVIRNWILDNTESERVVMIDDDVSEIGGYENLDKIKLTSVEVYKLINTGFGLIEDMGINLFGLNVQSDKKFYREYSPFSLTSVVLGPFLCIKKCSLRFDESLGLKEDYDFFLQSIREYRKVLRFNKYHYVAKHKTQKGGCSTYRSIDKEMEQIKRFQKKWGSKIVRIERKTQNGNTSINPIVSVPIKGI